MPLIIPKTLPAYDALYEENVFVMQQIDHLLHGHALTDDVRLDFISQIGFHLVLPP